MDDLKNNEINDLVDAKTDLENKVVCEKMSWEESKIWPIDLDGIFNFAKQQVFVPFFKGNLNDLKNDQTILNLENVVETLNDNLIIGTFIRLILLNFVERLSDFV